MESASQRPCQGRHNRSVIEEIRRRLAAYQAHAILDEGRARAAVLIPLYDRQGELHVVLTKRTDSVGNHRSEISFPGGAMEVTDLDLTMTALRESDEEIGLRREHVEIIGRVDDLVTVSRFHVTAYVGAIDPSVSPYSWQPHEAEVAEIIEVPLRHLVDRANLVELPRHRNGETIAMEGFRFGEHVIWGATGRMLRNFLDVALAAERTVWSG